MKARWKIISFSSDAINDYNKNAQSENEEFFDFLNNEFDYAYDSI